MISKKFKKIIIIFCLIMLMLLNLSFVFAEGNEPNLTAKAAILIDTKTGRVLYSKNENEKMYPASTTKILTAILTLENCNLDDVVVVKHDISASIPYGYTTVELQIGEQFSVEQLLEILMVYSANDVASLLAEHVGGSLDGFNYMMNQKLAELGLTNTHFTNPSGIHDDNHYTTARDLASLMEYCTKNYDFRRLSGMSSCNIPATNKHSARSFESTDKLIVPNSSYYYEYVTCGKTGYTTEAGQCLVSCAYKDGFELLGVVLGGEIVNGVSTRFTESKILYEYGYSNYSLQTLLNQDDIVTQIEVKNGAVSNKNLDLLAFNPISALLANTQKPSDFEYTIHLNDDIKAPIYEGDVLGTVSYTIDNYEYTTDLVASHDVEKSFFLYSVIEILIGLILIIIVYFMLSHRKKVNRKKRYR